MTYADNGTVKSNTIAILAIITRMRQACLHPTLLLKSGSKAADPSQRLVRNMVAKWVAKRSGTEEPEEVLEKLDESDEELQPMCMHCEDVGRRQAALVSIYAYLLGNPSDR
jgi:DNA repair protein RAD5